MYRYYLKNRPPSIGTHPSGNVNTVCFDVKEYAGEVYGYAWGYVEYEQRLTEKQVEDYELIEVNQFTKLQAYAKQAMNQAIGNMQDAESKSDDVTAAWHEGFIDAMERVLEWR